MAGITIQIVFLLAVLLGLFHPSPDVSEVDRQLAPIAWAAVGALTITAARSVFLGVYLSSDHVRVRSWLRTYTIPLDAETRCNAVRWSSWFATRGYEYRSVQMLFLSWLVDGKRVSRPFPATAARRSRAIAQADIVNAFIAATVSGSTPDPRDFARGTEWKRVNRDSRARLAVRDAERATRRRTSRSLV